ncbi:MAG TPA: hypothetical protein DCY20_01975, partial [Firmicutes bacterium]|nr:hypothetical protein [Bacillota bacterium]
VKTGTTALAVTGTVTLDSDALVTVKTGTTALSVTGTVAIANTVDIKISDRIVTSTHLVFTVSDLPAVFPLDVSKYRDFTYFVKNNSTSVTANVNVQIAPISSNGYWVDSPSVGKSVGYGQNALLISENYLNWARLNIVATGLTENIEVYFVGQM